MATFTVRPEGIIRQPALSMPGNATGSEAACTALTGSQIRAICGLGTTDNVTFNTVTATTSVLTPLVNNASAALTLGNVTYGVTVPGETLIDKSIRFGGAAPWGTFFGNTSTSSRVAIDAHAPSLYDANNYPIVRAVGGAELILRNAYGVKIRNLPDTSDMSFSAGAATFSGDISMQKTSAQGYIRSHGLDAVGRYTEMYHDGTRGYVTSNFGGLNLNPDGYVRVSEIAAVSSGGQIKIGYNYSTYVVMNGFINYGADVRIYSKTTTSHALGLMGLSGQTAALFECQDNGGSDIFTVEVTGASRNWSSGQTKYTQTIHDGTNGILSTSSGNLNLVPTGGTVAVTGSITASGSILTSADGLFIGHSVGGSRRYASQVANLGASQYYTATGQNMAEAGTLYDSSKQGGGIYFDDRSGVDPIRFVYHAAGSGTTVQALGISTVGHATFAAGITASGVVSHGTYTVATLPAAGSNAGKMAQVTDSNVAASGNYGATVAAGGANRVKVFSDGTNWVIA